MGRLMAETVVAVSTVPHIWASGAPLTITDTNANEKAGRPEF
jgi:hypothetical protein